MDWAAYGSSMFAYCSGAYSPSRRECQLSALAFAVASIHSFCFKTHQFEGSPEVTFIDGQSAVRVRPHHVPQVLLANHRTGGVRLGDLRKCEAV
jgi:hypothetical protein